jgi:endoglucanase
MSKPILIDRLESRVLLVGTLSEQIMVDQIGYRADARKFVVFADPQAGQNAAVTFVPGGGFQVRRVADDSVALSGGIVQWKAGLTHAASGDRAWHGDFTTLTAPGDYYIYEPTTDRRSHAFRVEAGVYSDVLKTAGRVFYYQRSGVDLLSQHGGNWNHPASHVGPNQDRAAQLWNGAAAGNPRDVSGGWYDAGDPNRYIPFTTSVLWNLMQAYEWNTQAFADNWNIPESGNGVADMLDEIKFELDWMLKMQLPDGSVLNRVSNKTYTNYGGWAAEPEPRYYTAATTWATASFAASMAHAARVYASFDGAFAGYSTTLLNASRNAWAYLNLTPTMTPASGVDGGGSGGSPTGLASVEAGSDANNDRRLRILASAELWKTTGETPFKIYFEANYNNQAGTSENGHHPLAGSYPRFDPSVATDLNRAFVVYATTAGANAAIVSAIRTSLANQIAIIENEYNSRNDPYLAFMWDGHYSWGSNQLKNDWANLLHYQVALNPTFPSVGVWRDIAEQHVHYIHGVNPLNRTYLTNMASLGAEHSVTTMYHGWMGDGTIYDSTATGVGPAPGYLVGGPNQNFTVTAISPPAGEPAMKAYKDWNTGWPENSWEITEPANYYQASYLLNLSRFASSQDSVAPTVVGGAFEDSTSHSVRVTFSERVSATVSASDFVLTNLTTNAIVPISNLSYVSSTNSASLRFDPTLLPTASYRLTLASGRVADVAGNRLASTYTLNFTHVRGDFDRSGVVDFADLLTLAQNFGQAGTYPTGDADYDGTVTFSDLLIVAQQFGVSLVRISDDRTRRSTLAELESA